TTRRKVTLGDAVDEPWIVWRPGSTYHHLVLTACMAAGFTPNIAHYADEWETGTALVAHGFGVILVPRLARLHRHWPIARIPFHGEPAPARRIFADTPLGSLQRAFVQTGLDNLSATAVA